jgi:hypothetical protein
VTRSIALLGAALLVMGGATAFAWRRWSRRASVRALLRFRALVDRFKLTGKR